MQRDRFGMTPRDRLALAAAKLYHGEGLPQEAVAAQLHVSRPTVSKLLATARRRGFVRTQVLGSRGALWAHPAGHELVEGMSVQAVDTTGAGDAFIGCFTNAWVGSGDVLAAIRRGNRYAADSVTRAGTQTSYATAEPR